MNVGSVNVLLAPHNDDETLFASYTLLREQPHVIVCLKSARMGAHYYPRPHITAETREAETDAAMGVLGCTWEQWDIPDDEPARYLADRLHDRLTELDAEHVWAPAVEDTGHDQHNLIGQLADDTFGPENVTHYTTYTRARGRSRGSHHVPYTPDMHRLKGEAQSCYESQAAHPMTGMWFDDVHDEFYV